MDLAQSALKLWASTKVVKGVAKRGWRLPVLGALIAGGTMAARKLRDRSEPESTYAPPAAATPPQPDLKLHDKPHGDPATNLPNPGEEVAPNADAVATPGPETT